MVGQEFKVVAVVRELDCGAQLVEAVLFPEASSYGDRPARLQSELSRHVRDLAAAGPLADVHRRRLAGTPAVGSVELTVDPPGRAAVADAAAEPPAKPVPAWTTPLPVRFAVVRWRHGDDPRAPHVAFVPALGIEVVAATAEELDILLPQHVRFALMRTGSIRSLRDLVYLQRTTDVRVEGIDVGVPVKTPKQLAVEAQRDEPEKPVIDEVGVDLGKQRLSTAWERDDVARQIADALSGRHPRSVLLVGPSGVGKTASLHELVRRREAFGLAETPVWATSGSRLVAGMTGFGMWQARCLRLCKEAAKAGAVLYLGGLVELMEVGKSTHNAQGIASFLRPYLSRGDFLAVAECTPEQLAVVERADPHLVDVFRRIDVAELPAEASKVVLLNFLLANGRPGKGSDGVPAAAGPAVDEDGLETVDRLHRRYATYSASPARPLRFLRNLLRDRRADGLMGTVGGSQNAASETTLGRRDIVAAFARETGLPLFLLDEAVPLDLAAARRWFAGRVIGQDDAVGLVVDLITTVKAAMNRPRRPIASLLFIGPTGVGKTEMAKTLAEFFFGSRDRLVRFDMSEFASPAAVERLVGSAGCGTWAGGDAPGGEGLLTAKVREQPFCVVLLDEFEKAHPALFDLMLQVLGEGRLTDAAGRVADFANAVVVMTSNLGAESFSATPFGLVAAARNGNGHGIGHRNRHGRDHFTEAVRDFFRPELFNRIDRVVPFDPLDEAVVLGIARRELDLVRRRDGVRLRGVDLAASAEAVRLVARGGFDARYGARPLKRAVERELLVPLADGLNGYAESATLEARAEAAGGDAAGLRVTVRARPGAVRATAAGGSGAEAAAVAECAGLRRDLQRLQRSAVTLGLQNDIYTLRRLRDRLARERMKRAWRRTSGRKGSPDGNAKKGRAAPRPYVGAGDDARLARLPRLEAVAEEMKRLTGEVVALENELLLALYDAGTGPAGDGGPCPRAGLAGTRGAWDALLLSLYALRFQKPDHVIVSVYGESPAALFDLAGAYHRAAAAAGYSAALYRFEFTDDPDPNAAGEKLIKRYVVEKPESFLQAPKGQPLGLTLAVGGRYACPRFVSEGGQHIVRRDRQDRWRCLVVTDETPLAGHYPLRPSEQEETIKVASRRRVYDFDYDVLQDDATGSPFRWTGRRWEEAFQAAVAASLDKAMRAVVDG